MAPIANLYDDFNDGVFPGAKWSVGGGTWVESGGTLCATMPDAFAFIASTSFYSLQQSSAFLEIVSYLNGAGASAGTSVFRLQNSDDFVEIRINASTGNVDFRWIENNVVQAVSTITYNSVTMRWLRLRQVAGTVYYETSPDGVTWTTRFTTVAQSWTASVQVIIIQNQTGGVAATKCIDNFNIASASARPVSVGSEFTVSADGKLGTERCGQADVAWGYGCSQSAYNALRKSEDPCGLWVQPPAKQLVGVEAEVSSTSAQDGATLITLNLTNPDPCRTMLFYLPLIAGMKMVVTSSEAEAGPSNVFNWTLGVQVTGVDNPDSGFVPVTANDFGVSVMTHLWRGEADYYWTAGPGESTLIEVKLKVFSGGGNAKLTQLQARLGYIGMSVVA